MDDVVDAALVAMENEGCVAEVVNVGSGRETSINELAKFLIGILGVEDVKPKYSDARVGDIKRSCARIDKTGRLLGFKPKFSFEEGIKKLLVSEMRHEYNQ